MDAGTIVVVVLLVLFLGGAVGADVHSRYQSRRGPGVEPVPEEPTKPSK
jgi:hypothetical protein